MYVYTHICIYIYICIHMSLHPLDLASAIRPRTAYA